MHLISDTQPQVSHDNIQKRAMNFKNKYTPAPPSPTGEKIKGIKKRKNKQIQVILSQRVKNERP